MIHQSIDTLLILPEVFQLILVNTFLLFALSFSGYFYQKLPKTVTSCDVGSALRTGHFFTPLQVVEPVLWLVVLSLVFSALLYVNNPVHFGVGLTQSIIVDPLAKIFKILLSLSSAAALALSVSTLRRFSSYEFVLIIYLAIMGMFCLASSYNFLVMYLSIELQSLSFYMLAGMRSRSESSAEASLKYFILSAFSSSILLLGMTLIYASIGSINFADLNLFLSHYVAMDQVSALPLSLLIGLACICVSLLFKLAAAPFHAWVADVYEGSPTNITAFFAITAKIAVLCVLIRMVHFSQATDLMTLISYVAIMSLVVGSISAMRQSKIKRLIAFSSVANVGWFLLAMSSGQWDALVLHLTIYIVLSVTIFSILMMPIYRNQPELEYKPRIDAKMGVIDYGADANTIKYLSDLQQVYQTHPGIAFAMTLAMFSLAGIPPLAGFYSKYLILHSLVQSEQMMVLGIALTTAVISAFYYIRMIRTMYFTTYIDSAISTGVIAKPTNIEKRQWFSICSTAMSQAYLIASTTFFTLFFILRPEYLTVWLAVSH